MCPEFTCLRPFLACAVALTVSTSIAEARPQTALPASYRLARSFEASIGDDAASEEGEMAVPEDAETPWRLFDGLFGDSGIEAGGWVTLGYHTESNDLFNTDPDRINLQQAWLFTERLASADSGELDFGFRFDALFGTDGGDTVSFGNGVGSDGDLQGWDAGSNFQRGSGYGWALPQAYVEVASGDLSAKVGHFYTLIGYEVVGAPGNFFYSHAITMYNSEPFTHTGVLGSYTMDEDTTIYGGWTAGWDTGFEQFEEGSNFLGGVSTSLSDNVALAYMTTLGDFGQRGSSGYMQSVVLDVAINEKLSYVAQSDILHVGSTGEDHVGLNQYLFYTLNDTTALGLRFEWWKADAITGYAPHGGTSPTSGSVSHFETTFGINYKLGPNIMFRPEYRYDWSEGADYNQGLFGFDIVATF